MKILPNILIILADDVGTGDVPGYWGNHIVDMPNLMKLQSQGVTFMDAHSAPLCAPSRYMLLSGNYPHHGKYHGGAWGLSGGENNFKGEQKSLAHFLKNTAGYHTAMFGKWHLGAGVPPPGRYTNSTHILKGSGSDWKNPLIDGPLDIGFEHSYMTLGGIQAPPYSFFRNGILDHDISDVEYWAIGDYSMASGDVSMIKEGGEGSKYWDSTSYNRILVNETLSFLDRHMETRADDPFFTYVALGQVHIPHSPPKYYLDGTPIAGRYETGHLDLLFEMDKVIGSLVSAVEERGMGNNTIFIFSSDNGGLDMGYPNRYLRGHKGAIYEGGHRVPLVMRYDGVFPRGERRHDHFVGLNDMYATLAEIVGVTVPDTSAQDSVSFAKYIQSGNNTMGLREYVGSWIFKHNTVAAEAIRHKNFKLVRNYAMGQDELYDMEKDVQETRNIIGNPHLKDIVEQMNKELRKIGPCPLDADANDVFYLNNEGDEREVTCEWFRENRARCQQHIIGDIMCFSICGRRDKMCKKQYPGSADINFCVDNIDFTLILDDGSKADCAWLELNAEKKENYCNIEVVSKNCGRSCGICETMSSSAPFPHPNVNSEIANENTSCVDNVEFKFMNGSNRDCAWLVLHPKKMEIRKEINCKIEAVSKNCRRTCGTCETISNKDTTHQVLTPSSAPILLPNVKSEIAHEKDENNTKHFRDSPDGLSDQI